MNTKSINRIAALGAVMIGGASLCQAEVTITLEGSINGLFGVAGDPNPFFEVGDAMLLTLSFEEFTNGFQTGVTGRSFAMTSFSGDVGLYSFGGSTGRVFARNDGVVPGIFGGNPYDQFNVTFQNEVVNNASLGIDRNDFEYDSGSIGGFRLHSVGFNVQTDDTSMLNGLDINEAALGNLDQFLDLFTFRMFFMNESSGSVPGSVGVDFSSITVTPAPGALGALAMTGLLVSRRRRSSACY